MLRMSLARLVSFAVLFVAIGAPACSSSDASPDDGGGGHAGEFAAGGAGGEGAGGGQGGAALGCSPACPAHRVCLPDVNACVVEADLGPPDAGLADVFESIWSFYDTEYGAFPIKEVDWAAVREATLSEIADAPSRFWQLWAITGAVAAIGDGHTGAYAFDICGATSGLAANFTNTGACVTEVDGRLVVYATSAESTLEVGDEIVAVDDRAVASLIGDVVHQPRCAASTSTSEQARWQAVDSVMFRPDGDETFTVVRGDETIPVPIERITPQSCQRLLPPPLDVDHGSGVTSTLLASGALYVRLPTFFVLDANGNPDAASLTASLRDAFELAPAEGVILDVRSNPGGFPAVYMALASWLFDAETDLFQCQSKDGPGHDDHGLAWTMTSAPDPTLHYAGPLALLVDARSFSAADFTYGWMSETGRARTFGHRSGGGFGNGASETNVGGAHFQLGYNDILCRSMAGEPLEGSPPPIAEPVALTEAGIAAGQDDVIVAAETWLVAQ